MKDLMEDLVQEYKKTKEMFEQDLPLKLRREIMILYKLGVSLDEIRYLTKVKFGRNLEVNEIVKFLFSYV